MELNIDGLTLMERGALEWRGAFWRGAKRCRGEALGASVSHRSAGSVGKTAKHWERRQLAGT
ncbi:MAG: hypothetical protein DKT66_25985 [Candidatus Melainabacteria bacterium]|nr:MAG: hypothetical protein DKT66_25985 [Candidatus Melainabacteria bacterium]